MRTSSFAQRATPLLVSFSGVDGSGKSTQIELLRDRLKSAGLTVKVLTLWDDVVALSSHREQFVHLIYGSEKGVGSPARPVMRRDKNVRKWYLNISRYFLYLLDAVNLARVVRRADSSGADVVIFDRYIYDELANLPLSNPFTRHFVQFLHWLVPKPDLAYVLDADAEAARARKPEYPVEFMRECRAAYLHLAALLGSMTVIGPLPLSETTKEVETVAMQALGIQQPSSSCLDTATV